MEWDNVDRSMFQPLFRNVWAPSEVKIALSIAILHRMPERFKNEEKFERARRSLQRFVHVDPLLNGTRLPIKYVCFDGDAIVLRKDSEAILKRNSVSSTRIIYFDANFHCFIAFEDPNDLIKLRLIQQRMW